MSLLDKLERTFGRLAIPGLPLVLVAGQSIAWLAMERGIVGPGTFVLLPELVREGQWWRLGSFLFNPPGASLLFLIFALYLFYFMASALEGFWGTFRFNVFLLVGYLLTVGAGFLFDQPVFNLFLEGSVFFAFAYLNPTFELNIFFILPVQVRWLAAITWGLYAYGFIRGSTATRVEILASVGNFLLFFGRDIYLTLRLRSRSVASGAARMNPVRVDEPRHRCRVCGRTDRSNPELDFRYCSKCSGEQCYCSDHIFNHTHVTAEDEAAKKA